DSVKAEQPVAQVPSEGPAPTPAKAVQQPKPQANKDGDSAAHVQRPAPSPPAASQPIPASATESKSAEKPEQQHDYTTAEWRLVQVTLLLVIVTAALAVYTANLWGATKRLAEDAKTTSDRQAREVRESLDIGQRTVKTMENTAEHQLRAYLLARQA